MKKPYHEVTIFKKTLNKRVFALIFCILVLAITSFVSFLLSPILNLSYVISKNSNSFQKSYYFVCLNTQTKNKDDATKEAQNLKSRGGAGVLILKENYFVVASCYENEEEAKNIAKNLTTEGKIFCVNKESFSFNTKKLNNDEKKQFLKYFSFLTTKLFEIYLLANNLDKKEETNVSVNLKLKSIKNEGAALFQNLQTFDDEKFSQLKKAYLNFLSAVEYACSEKHTDSAIIPYSSILREMICHFVLSFQK